MKRIRIIRMFWLMAFVSVPMAAWAHRLDECLQASFISVGPNRIDVDVSLTPGVEMTGWILPSIDPDHDGIVSTAEGAAYAERVRSGLSLKVDSRELLLLLSSSRFPGVGEMAEGLGVIQLRFSADAAGLVPGIHRLSYQNHYLTNYSVYQANALVPETGAVSIGRQERDLVQTRLEFDYTLAADIDATETLPGRSNGEWSGRLVICVGIILLVWWAFRSRTARLRRL
jgi:hypothetical protein